MRYQLGLLGQWVEELQKENNSVSGAIKAGLEKETARITRSFDEMICSNLSNEILERFFGTQQKSLLGLKEKLNAGKPTDANMALLKAIDDLETYLQENFVRYVDWQFPAEQNIIKDTVSLIDKSIADFENLFEKHLDEKPLQEIILSALENAKEKTACSLAEVQFIKAICNLPHRLSHPCITEKNKSFEQVLLDALLRINFNGPQLLNYCKQKIKDKIAPLPTIPEEIFCLGKLKNYFDHIPHNKLALDHSRVPIAVTLSEWVTLLIQLKQSEMEGKYIDESEAGGKNIDSRKVVTSLTIVELGLLVRLFIMAGVFRTTNKRGLARLLSRIVSTQYKGTAETIDEMHLYASIISAKGAALDTVQAILNRMLSKLQKIRMENKQKNKSAKTG